MDKSLATNSEMARTSVKFAHFLKILIDCAGLYSAISFSQKKAKFFLIECKIRGIGQSERALKCEKIIKMNASSRDRVCQILKSKFDRWFDKKDKQSVVQTLELCERVPKELIEKLKEA